MDRVENQRNSQNRTFSLFSSLHSGLVWPPMPSHHLKRGQQLLNLRFISHYSRGETVSLRLCPNFLWKNAFPYSLLFVLLCSNITSVSWFLPFMKNWRFFLSVRIQLEKVRKLLSGFSLVYKFLEHRGVQFSCIGSYGRFSLYDLKK